MGASFNQLHVTVSDMVNISLHSQIAAVFNYYSQIAAIFNNRANSLPPK
jgi:hypothetical protein